MDWLEKLLISIGPKSQFLITSIAILLSGWFVRRYVQDVDSRLEDLEEHVNTTHDDVMHMQNRFTEFKGSVTGEIKVLGTKIDNLSSSLDTINTELKSHFTEGKEFQAYVYKHLG
jgi:chaperonin cofactor prefoldin